MASPPAITHYSSGSSLCVSAHSLSFCLPLDETSSAHVIQTKTGKSSYYSSGNSWCKTQRAAFIGRKRLSSGDSDWNTGRECEKWQMYGCYWGLMVKTACWGDTVIPRRSVAHHYNHTTLSLTRLDPIISSFPVKPCHWLMCIRTVSGLLL